MACFFEGGWADLPSGFCSSWTWTLLHFFGFKPQSSCSLGAYDNMSVMLVKICNPSPTPPPTKGSMYYLPLWWDGLQLEWGGRSRTWRQLPPFSVPAWTPVTTWTAGSRSPPPPTAALWITTWHDLVTHDNMDSRISVTTSTHCGSVDHNMTWPGDSWQHGQQDLGHHLHPLWLCGSQHDMTWWLMTTWTSGSRSPPPPTVALWITTWHDLVTHDNMDSRISVTNHTHCGSVDHNMTWPGDSWQHGQQDLSHQSRPLWLTTWHDLETRNIMDLCHHLQPL